MNNVRLLANLCIFIDEEQSKKQIGILSFKTKVVQGTLGCHQDERRPVRCTQYIYIPKDVPSVGFRPIFWEKKHLFIIMTLDGHLYNKAIYILRG